MAACCSWLAAQLKLLEWLAKVFELTKPAFLVTRLAWDETGLKCRVGNMTQKRP